MKKVFISILSFLFIALQLQAQTYQPTTKQTDSFSRALIQLLNCGINKFEGCKGDFFQTTLMSQQEYHLNIKFPNSIAGIVRSADWDKNAYVEFGPYADRYSMAKALKELKQKIKKALGKQLLEDKRADTLLFYTMNIEDENGHFGSSFELMAGTTREKSYLLAPTINTVDKSKPEHNFILLKVQGGVPSYYHNIPANLKPVDDSLDLALKQLIQLAAVDFKGLVPDSFFWAKKKEIHINGQLVSYNPRGGNHTASIIIPASTDSATQQKQIQYYHLVMQAAAGSNYIYNTSTLDAWQYIVYFNKNYDEKQPELYLYLINRNTATPFIELQVQSPIGHPVKRSRNYRPDEF